MDGICREHSESLRCAARRPRKGRQWALGVPSQGATHAVPELPSKAECAQRTRVRARALAGPEPASLLGRNRLQAGNKRHKQWALGSLFLMLTTMKYMNADARLVDGQEHDKQREANRQLTCNMVQGLKSAGRAMGEHNNKQQALVPAFQVIAIMNMNVEARLVDGHEHDKQREANRPLTCNMVQGWRSAGRAMGDHNNVQQAPIPASQLIAMMNMEVATLPVDGEAHDKQLDKQRWVA
eukprot:1442579-Pleurochrysis_carterae.AAC.1